MRRLLCLAVVFVALMPVVFHWQYMSGDRILYAGDTAQGQYPRYKILCDALQHEVSLPLWQSWLYAGSPFHANPENPTLYPPVLLLARFLTPTWTINLTILSHMALAAAGMFFLVRRLWLRISPEPGRSSVAIAGAMVGATMFALSGWTRTDLLNGVAQGASHAFIPWVLLAADAMLEGPHPRRAAGALGLLVGFQAMTGGLGIILYASFSLALWILFLGVFSGRERARRALVYGALAVTLAALIISAKYLPFHEWVASTNRGPRLDYAEARGMTLGGAEASLDWSLLVKRLSWYTFYGLTVVLALTALPLWRRSGVVRFGFTLVALLFLIALGTPLYRLAYEFVPMFDHTRGAVRAWKGINAFLPLLGGLGVCGLLARFQSLRERPIAVGSIGAALALLLSPFLAYSFRYEKMFANPEWFSDLPSLYTNWPEAARRCGKDWRAVFAGMKAPDQRCEQFISTVLEVETPSGYLGHIWPRALEQHLYGGSAQRMSDELRLRRLGTLSVRWMVATSRAPDAPPLSALVQPAGIDGNTLVENPFARARAFEPSAVVAVYGDADSEVAYAMLDEADFPATSACTIQLAPDRELSADELGALHALILRGEPTVQSARAAAALRASDKRVVETSLPLSESDRNELRDLARELAALEREPIVARFERLGADSTQVTRADPSLGRWLVVSEPWAMYPGWTARTRDGATLGIEHADGVSSAIFLRGGEASLRADYAPRSVTIGLWLYFAGVIAGLLAALWPERPGALAARRTALASGPSDRSGDRRLHWFRRSLFRAP